MALAFQLTVSESIGELRALQRRHGELIGKRLLMLITIKRHEPAGGISKRTLSELTGINHNRIVKWRQLYLQKGIAPLLVHGRGGGAKKSVVSTQNHARIAEKLKDPENGIRGYTELLQWAKEELSMDICYITLLKYVQRHFGASIKVARKSHVKKEAAVVDTFKKTLPGNAGR